ncbi:alcohol dehydrogenase [Sphingobium sp. SCG-1]|uniref:iron-containing alcohol dehydrogenase n=1 Tax=Sphingobium sp. SCG-1 TaxID=2072936 RepID=UPI000CD67F05|nr:iron-containing alcohol dehydrogenase [Sphingobium sp. SCG-1]AUW57780.1 alcohol dehydrogenase [Sphingobium sp. SCG-1]
MQFELGVTRAPSRLLFGAGQRHAIGMAAASLGTRALICTDSRLADAPLMAEISADLRAHGLEVEIFGDTQPELPADGIYACVERYTAFDPDVLIGIGGGSCLDLAKLVSLLLSHGGPLSNYYGEFKVPSAIRPLILVPTTSGTGSEVTPVAVIGDPQREMKVGISSPELIPHTAICDPELTLTCPSSLTAISGADALGHAIEAFAAVRRPPDPDIAFKRVFIGKNILSDHYARSAIRLLFRWLPTAVREGGDIEARSAVMLASTLAGLAFGTAGTGAAHAIQYPVGALTHTAHGLGIGVLLPYTMSFNVSVAREIYEEIADLVEDSVTDGDKAGAAITAVRKLFADIGIPVGIDALGVSEADVEWLAERSILATRLVENNRRDLDLAGAASILRDALSASHHFKSE